MRHSTPRHMLAFIRGLASYTALIGGMGCLFWLAQRIEAVPVLQWGPWDGPGGPMAPLVVLDAGHGGQDGGAVANGMIEKVTALQLAHAVRLHLERQGVRVKMTRDNDVFIPLELRSAAANDARASAFVSLHLNTSVDALEVSGIETYFSNRKAPFQPHTRDVAPPEMAKDKEAAPPTPQIQIQTRDPLGEKLARSIQRHACETSRAENRGIKERSYAVLLHTFVPAALIECGFLTSKTEAAKLQKADYRDHMAAGIARGITSFLHTQPLQPAAPSQETPPPPRHETSGTPVTAVPEP